MSRTRAVGTLSIPFACALAALGCVALAPAARADSSSEGYATVASIDYGPESFVNGSTGTASVNGIQMTGGILDTTQSATDVEIREVLSDLQVGTFNGTAYYCQTPNSCSSTFGPFTLFDNSVVPLTGETRSGLPISGSCQGGGITEGGEGVTNSVIETSCNATMGSLPLGSFTLVVNVTPSSPLAAYTGAYTGIFCTGTPAAACAQTLGLSNPFPT